MRGSKNDLSIECAVEYIRSNHNVSAQDKNGRYLSWKYCYDAFTKHRNKKNEEIIDYLSLHLAFYLASWGMYRGSSFLLLKDYKVHKPAVQIILEDKYQILHGMSAEELCDSDNLELVMVLSEEIRESYEKQKESYNGKKNTVTETLVTKILLGTLGCVPAYDRYFVSSIRKHKIAVGTFGKKSLKQLTEYYLDNKNEFEKVRGEINKLGTEYPVMKIVDMCMWQAAYEAEKNSDHD